MSHLPAKSLSLLPNDPELVFGLVGPLGANLAAVEAALQKALEEVSYKCEPPISLSSDAQTLARALARDLTASTVKAHKELVAEFASHPEHSSASPKLYAHKMNLGNHLRRLTDMPDALALLAVLKIREYRKNVYESQPGKKPADSKNPIPPIPRQAYVAHQLKRPEEVETLRRIYGDTFILLGVYSSRRDRIENLARRFYSEGGASFPTIEAAQAEAERLVQRDTEEDGNKNFGQAVRKTFSLADAFIDGDLPPEELEKSVARLIRLLFWHPAVTPTPEEYAMFLAQGAALRSADLGRHVGAAITTDDGQILSLGCNEVAHPGGGLAWGNEEPDTRDVNYQNKLDTNTTEKLRILGELIERLGKRGWLKEGCEINAADLHILAKDALKETRLMGLIEFLRPVHGEMAALMDAARRGISVSGGILYVTTFPCHECAKHIVAAGIKKVIFIEPYPKSQVEILFRDSISVDRQGSGPHIPFEPFIGIAPRRYQTFFAMPGKILDATGDVLVDGRRDGKGQILDWTAIKKRLSPKLAGYFRLYSAHERDMAAALEEALVRVKAEVAPPPPKNSKKQGGKR